MDTNSVVLVGRLTRDVEIRFANNGTPIASFSLALNSRRKSGDEWIEESHFIDCVLIGQVVESIGEYLVKGKQIAVTGSLQQDRWEKDGQKRSKVQVFVRNVQLLGGAQGAA